MILTLRNHSAPGKAGIAYLPTNGRYWLGLPEPVRQEWRETSHCHAYLLCHRR
jgi:hypothetical protein